MALTIDQLEQEARKLSPEDRGELLDRLLRSYQKTVELEQDVARAWIEEAERRDQTLVQGEELEVPAAEVFSRIRSSLRR